MGGDDTLVEIAAYDDVGRMIGGGSGNDAAASIFRRVGFADVGTACIFGELGG